jgi:hypothetical protein
MTSNSATEMSAVSHGIADRSIGCRRLARCTVVRGAACVVAALALAVIVPVGTMAASSRHEYSGISFGPAGAMGAAFDQQRDVLYIEKDGSIDKFNAAGEPVNFSGSAPYINGNELAVSGLGTCGGVSEPGIAVDSTNGRIYVKRANTITAFEPSGELSQFSSLGSSEIGGFSALCGVAVDAYGAIYAVENSGSRGIKIYGQDGEFITSIKTEGEAWVDAVDTHGVVYFRETHFLSEPVQKYIPSTFPVTHATTYVYAGTVEAHTAESGQQFILAVDPATNDLYSDGFEIVKHYDDAGNLIERFPESGDPGEFFSSFGITVADTSEGATVYVTSTAAQSKIFIPVPVPDATTGSPDEVAETTAVLQGSVNPHGLPTTYQFEYGTTASYGATEPLPPSSAGSSKQSVAVGVSIGGLAPDTTYHYRLSATNEKGTTVGLDRTFSTIAPPGVSQLTVADLGSSSVSLRALVNPHHSATSYRFEYGPSDSYGISLPVPEGEVGSDDVGHPVAVHLSGLKSGAVYHWRVVASNEAGVTASEDVSFATFATPSGPSGSVLPDGRAWEMVSPQDKNGGDLGQRFAMEYTLPGLFDRNVQVTGLTVQSSTDGNSVEFESNLAAFANPLGAALTDNAYVAARGAQDWSTQSLAPPFVSGGLVNILASPSFQGYDANLDKALFFQPYDQSPLSPEAPEGADGLYVRQTGDGSYRYVGGSDFQGDIVSKLEGISEDYEHVLVNGSQGCSELYRDQEGKPQRRLVTILPAATPVAGRCGGGGVEGHRLHEHEIAPDGSRIVFQTGGLGCLSEPAERLFVMGFSTCDGPRTEIYLRENATTTRLLSGYAPGAPVDPGAGSSQVFQGADRQVTKVFFTSQTRLTAESTAGHSAGNGTTTGSLGDLYRYDTETNGGAGELQDLTIDNVSPEGAQVLGVLGNSDDGGKVYFVARSDQLTGQGVPGQANLYLWDENGGSPTTTFIATLQPLGAGDGTGDSANWASDSYIRSSEVTPDGEHLLFTSKERLTDFDNSGRSEVYVYDAHSHELMCASCAGDQPPAGDSFPPYTELMESIFTDSHPHAISADGNYVFFSSAAALVPADSNGKFDAYEYNTQTHRVALLSSGRGSNDSFFLGASPSGHDAFFVTRSKLVAADTDDNLDLYDARIGGGIPAQTETSALPTCQGDSCQPPVSAPIDPTPASAGFEGPGNPPAVGPVVKKPKKPAAKKQRRAGRRRGVTVRRRHGHRANSTHRHR